MIQRKPVSHHDGLPKARYKQGNGDDMAILCDDSMEQCRMNAITVHVDAGPRDNIEDDSAALLVAHPLSHGNDSCVLAVFDGVGGHDGGAIASALAKTEVLASLAGDLATVTCHKASSRRDPKSLIDSLLAACDRANEAICRRAETRHELRHMATTAVCAVIADGLIAVVWAGDSRCYLHSGSSLERVTHDHSATQELIDAHVIGEDQAHTHPDAHVITQYLGRRKGFRCSTRVLPLAEGDVVLLCTDGLTDVVTDGDIAKSVCAYQKGGQSLSALPTTLVQQALVAGTQDNVTVLCCEYKSRGSPVANNTAHTLTSGYVVRLAQVVHAHE